MPDVSSAVVGAGAPLDATRSRARLRMTSRFAMMKSSSTWTQCGGARADTRRRAPITARGVGATLGPLRAPPCRERKRIAPLVYVVAIATTVGAAISRRYFGQIARLLFRAARGQ